MEALNDRISRPRSHTAKAYQSTARTSIERLVAYRAPVKHSNASIVIAFALSVTMLASVGAAEPAAAVAAAADAGCASFGSSFAAEPIDGDGSGLRLGCARDAGSLRSLASNDSDLMAAIDFKATQRPDQLRQAMSLAADTIRADLGRGLSLSQALTLRAQRDSVGFRPQTGDLRFGGNIQVVGDSLVIVVPAGDLGTAALWQTFWQKLISGLVGVAAGVVAMTSCLLAFSVGAPAAAPVCAAVSGAFAGGVPEVVNAALDGQPIDQNAWSAAIANAMIGAVAGAFLGALTRYLTEDAGTLIVKAQETVRRYASKVASGVPEAATSIVTFADLNGDGRDDYLLVRRDTGAVRALINNGGDPA